MEEVKNWVHLGIKLTLRLSRVGSGLYLRVPTEIARSLNLEKGDLLVLTIHKKGVKGPGE